MLVKKIDYDYPDLSSDSRKLTNISYDITILQRILIYCISNNSFMLVHIQLAFNWYQTL